MGKSVRRCRQSRKRFSGTAAATAATDAAAAGSASTSAAGAAATGSASTAASGPDTAATDTPGSAATTIAAPGSDSANRTAAAIAAAAGSASADSTTPFAGSVAAAAGSSLVARIGVQRDSSGQVFKLDDPNSAKPYVGKAVKVTGKLDEQAMLIHVESIEGSES